MLEQQSTLRWLESRIKDLPDKQRETLVLSTMKGLRMKDIARVMGLPENTVKTRMFYARKRLREAWPGDDLRPGAGTEQGDAS